MSPTSRENCANELWDKDDEEELLLLLSQLWFLLIPPSLFKRKLYVKFSMLSASDCDWSVTSGGFSNPPVVGFGDVAVVSSTCAAVAAAVDFGVVVDVVGFIFLLLFPSELRGLFVNFAASAAAEDGSLLLLRVFFFLSLEWDGRDDL